MAIALGRDVSGAAVIDDLARLPHLLIAGATGAGKSVCINALIACLLCRNTPDDLSLLMIDPKRVELSIYGGIPHLIAPVVVETDRVVGVLQWVAREMERRYKVFAKVGARNIDTYNELALARDETKMPFIVVFIDELADLMLVAPDEVERLICRIAQMARATGIHLVIATQRPSVDVVTGLIKANFPARLSFAVSSQIDSRVVLDTPGAEKLLGSGDALYMAPDSPKLVRIQGCYVSDAELNRLVSFWKGQLVLRAKEQLPTTSPVEQVPSMQVEQRPLWPDMQRSKASRGGQDPLLKAAIDLVVAEQRASVSFLQRRLRIGYTRSARIVDLLESEDIIGPATGSSKPRAVLVTQEELQKRRAADQPD
jgi:S-DNA-T family DNA segregation ATPase FtsK/SpoIIIE